jgi:hypothetical protein
LLLAPRGKGCANDAPLHSLTFDLGGEQVSMCIGSFVERFCNKLVAVAAAVSMAVVCGAGAADASPVYYSCTGCSGGSATASFQGGMVAGSIFTASTAQTFNSVGFIDLNPSNVLNPPDGLLGAYQVGIWLVSTQTLLASAWVTPTSPAGIPFEGGPRFRWTNIPTTTIPAGEQFIVAALLPASPLDAWLVDDVHVNSVGVVGPGTGRFGIGGTLSYPSQTVSPFSVWSVANASSATVVPEPTAAISILFCLVGLATSRRSRRPGA